MSLPDNPDLAMTLAAVAQAMAVETELPALNARVCELAVEAVPACDHADVMTVTNGGHLTVPGASNWVGLRVVSFEEEFGEGPCIDAFRSKALVDAPDMATDGRWPDFAARCLSETPVRSGIGVPLLVGPRAIGSLDMYSNAPSAFDDADRAAAALFAVHAAVAFDAAHQRVHLERALANRDVIGQAKGILMAQSKVSADEAFELLRRASQRLNERLVVVAERIVREHERRSDDHG